MTSVTLPHDLIYTGALILVNAHYPYRESNAAHTLVPINSDPNKVLLDCEATEALGIIMKRLGSWEQIAAVSGWRSMCEQNEIYENSLRDNGREFTEKYVALPGHSEHQTGLAIDLALKQEQIDFICPDFPYTGICQRFRQNAASYGFIERYPRNKENITGISHEPWHFRYIGTPHAEIMEKYGFVLEEYIFFLKKYPYGKSPYVYQGKAGYIEVSYLKAEAADTIFEISENNAYSVSGNNIDGFIITERRTQNEGQ